MRENTNAIDLTVDGGDGTDVSEKIDFSWTINTSSLMARL